MNNARRLLASGFMFVTCIATVQAGVIAYENFETYSSGENNLQGGAGGVGWAGGWLAPVGSTVADVLSTAGNPLAFTPAGGLLIEGGTRAGQVWSSVNGGAGNNPAAARELATPLMSSFYAAYLMRYDNTNSPTGFFGNNNTFSLHLANSATATTSLNFGIRGPEATGDVDTFMIRSGTGGPLAGDAITNAVLNGNTYLFVARLTYSGTSYDQIDMWLNPAANSSGNPDLSLSLTPGAGLTSISHLFFRSAANQGDDRFAFDEIIVGSAWEDVVRVIPEPSSSLLLLAGSALLIFRRRFRRSL